MAHWIKLTDLASTSPLYVNLELAIYIGDAHGPKGGTRIVFERGDKPQILTVAESLEVVASELPDVRNA